MWAVPMQVSYDSVDRLEGLPEQTNKCSPGSKMHTEEAVSPKLRLMEEKLCGS